ncbi:dehydrogenase, partial [Candidatus Sumerlaeota bacterium]|nr:dehydrogenase [Candidatus Sumerlaeota bacterium]
MAEPADTLSSLRVPDGFEISRVATGDQIPFGMCMAFDETGRLFVTESTGKNLSGQEMAEHPECRVRLLEDTDGDGVFDKSKIFADKLSLPMGAQWYLGSLYVAAPPDFVRLDDADGDGVSEHREIIHHGWNVKNTASLHGPFLGPDGYMYLTHGRHGYKITTKEGDTLEGLAPRLWRCRPDGTKLERVCGGGFDNPVELVFTPAGEMVITMTYFTDPQNGQRDALLHLVEGGVYSKNHECVAEFKRTGDFMPVMSKFARIAPAGLMRYRGKGFGAEFEGNLFSSQFNPHRVQRHILARDGATFHTEDSDFLVSTDPDFHPTDVIEDADGSLLVLDTGGWYV